MKKTIILVLLFLLIISALYLLRENNLDDNYSIGVIVPLSGGAANIGTPFSKGFQMAIDEVNLNGGINDKRVILGVEDGEFSGNKSISSAQKLLNSINPDAFSVLFALPAQALSPIFEDKQKPFLEWDYSRDVIDVNEYAFKTGFDAESGCENFVRYAREKSLYKNLGVLMSKTPYNQDCFNGIKKVESEVFEYWYEFGTDDFRTLLTKSSNDNVDMLVTIPIDPEPVKIFKQINDLGLSTKIMCFTSSECIYPAVKEVVSDDILKGTLALDFIPTDLFSSDFANKFIKRYPKESGQASITWAAQGYDDAIIIIESMKKCRPKDSNCLIKELSSIRDYDSVIGSNGFSNQIQNLDMRKQVYDGQSWIDLK